MGALRESGGRLELTAERAILAGQIMRNSGHLLRTYLDTALVFLDIAAISGANADKKSASLRNAQKAYDTVRRLLRRIRLTNADVREIRRKLHHFEFALQQLQHEPGLRSGRRPGIHLVTPAGLSPQSNGNGHIEAPEPRLRVLSPGPSSADGSIIKQANRNRQFTRL